MKLGKWVTNIADPDSPNARGCMEDREWKHHLEYVDKFIIGPPKAGKYTVEKLESWGYIGLYKKPIETVPE